MDVNEELLITRTAGYGPVPGRPAYSGDCGLDLALLEDVVIAPGGTVNARTGIAVAVPRGTFGWVTGRSSTWATHRLQVMGGIIDEGWRGELMIMLHRPRLARDTQDKKIEAGTRLAQLIVLPNLLSCLVVREVEELPPGERGTRGFGSSGL